MSFFYTDNHRLLNIAQSETILHVCVSKGKDDLSFFFGEEQNKEKAFDS